MSSIKEVIYSKDISTDSTGKLSKYNLILSDEDRNFKIAVVLAALCFAINCFFDENPDSSESIIQTSLKEIQTNPNPDVSGRNLLRNITSLDVTANTSELPESKQKLLVDIAGMLIYLRGVVTEFLAAPKSIQLLESKRSSATNSHSTVDSNYDSELVDIFSAMDRVLTRSPRLRNQTIYMNEDEVAATALINTVSRMIKHSERFSDQRANFSTKNLALTALIDGIIKSQTRSMQNQRMPLNEKQLERIEVGKIGTIIERQLKGKYSDQVRIFSF